MNTAEFITRLRQMDIRVWVEDDRLRISAPKGVLTEALQHEIAARKPDLLAYLQQAEAQLAVPDTPIEPAARTGPLPLSFAQERMWILEQFEPDSASYNIAGAVRLRGQLDIAALGAAINGVVQRHEVLRTTFRVQDGQPVQQIAPALTVPLLQHDLTTQPVTARDAAARALMVAAAQRPFQLDEAPLLRVMLLRLAADEHMLAYTMHHIVSDGWSMNVFMREVVQLYRAAIAGQPASLPPLPVQYADFAVWQRAWLQGAVLVRQLAYWKRQLAAIEPLQLPTDRPRPPAQTHQGADFRAELPAGLVAGLQQLCRQQQVTLFMTLLAAFQALLHRLAGQDDVCVGTPIANRTRREVEPLIGFFVNTLVLRAQFDGDLTFRQLLRQVGQTTLAAYANQDVPFEKLVAELQPARDLSRSPLFQVMFVLQNVPSVDATLPDLTVTLLPVDNETAKFDLLLSAVEQPDGTLQLTWQYNTDLFDEATVARWMGHYETLLTGALADPDSPVDALPLLSPVELRQMLLAWNDTATPGRGLPLVHELAAAQAARTPGAVAVMAPPDADGRPGGQLTYAELEQRANQLAHRLQALGVASDVPVALLLPRSLDLAVAVLAVLKAGGAYLPLDPAYPPARLAFMLADAAAPVLLTRTDMQAVLETAVGGAGLPASVQHTLLLDAEAAQLAALPATPPAGQARPDSLIYVLYTSGSTGKPKGVALPHRAISNLVQWQLTQSTLPPEARTLQFAAISFDVFCQELFATWCAGGTVVMISETLRRDPVALLQLLAAQDVARLFLPFVALQHLAEVADLRGLAPHGLREVVTAGEQLQSTPQIVRLFSRLPACRLTNQYGPTESHVVTAYDLPPEPAAWPALPPIGRPIDNVQIYVLDGRLQPVPIGVAGELVIGGTNVACGYLHQPALTAERFVDLRLSLGDAAVHENAHCYCTGDLARFLPDGTLEYLGRADQQVKIRGYRIELEEVEAVLRQHAAVREAVVAPQALAGSQQLVAYVVPQPGAAPTTEALRAFLSETLPAHMLPATVVLLPALPLTPSGKVARSMLPAPPPVQPPASLTAPRTAVEQALTAIWEELLGVKPIGLHQDFFELGGHSLLAVHLFLRIEDAFGVNLPLATLFRGATVHDLAQIIAQHAGDSPWSALVDIQPGGRQPPFFCVHGGTGDVLWFGDLARHLGADQPFYGFQSIGLDGVQPPLETVEEMAARYIADMRRVQPTGPYYLGGYCFGGVIAYEMAQQLRATGETVALLTICSAVPPNTGFERMRFSWPFVRQFVSNVPYWMQNVWEIGPRAAWGRTLRRLKVLRNFLLRRPVMQQTADEIVDDALSLPAHRRQIIEANQRATRRYRPRPYAGDLTVFQPRTPSLLRVPVDGLGWDRLVQGETTVYTVPGSHQSIFKEPRVRVLAQRLRERLAAVRDG